MAPTLTLILALHTNSIASPSQPLPLRLAAAQAIGSSPMLRYHPSHPADPAGPSALRVWLLALDALEDDDEDVRSAMARQLSRVLAPSELGLHSAAVLQLGWGLVATRFGRSDGLLDEVGPRGRVVGRMWGWRRGGGRQG